MPITRLAANLMAAAINGATTCAFDSTGSIMLVGCSTAAFSSTSTWLGSSGWLSTMDAGYPTRTVCTTGTEFVFRGTYGTAAANIPWNEWGIWSGTSTGVNATLLNRKLEDPSLGTKTAAQTWQLTCKVVVSA